MTIEVFVDDIESIDESLREEYIQGDDGRYVLKGMATALEGYVPVDKVTEHESVLNLKKTLDKERDLKKEAERRARELEQASHGLTEEEKRELEELRRVKGEAEERRRREEGEFDKWREEIAQKHQNETKGLAEENAALKNALCEDRVSREIAAACNEFGGRANILEPLVRQAIKAEFAEDRVSISVMDGDGTRILDDQGQPLTINGYVERMSKDKEFGDLFASTQKSGGGSTSEAGSGEQAGSGAGGEMPANLKRSEMSKAEKVKFIREHGQEAFMGLPAA